MGKGHGGARQGAGRKPKADELELLAKLSPLDDKAFEALQKGVEKGDYNFTKLFMEYRFGKPKETVKMTHDLPKPARKVFSKFGNDTGE